MTRLPAIADLTESSVGWGFFLCSDRSVRTGRGGEYMALTLQDATGAVVGRIFDNLDRLRDEFEAGEFVKAQGRLNHFNGRLQFIVENIRRVLPDQDRAAGFREELLIPVAPRPLDEMWAELQQVVAGVEHPALRRLLEQIVSSHEARLRLWPAARAVHHAYRGGFLEHVLRMAEAGRTLAGLYDADESLVVAGALLHDIGKLLELDYDISTSYTRDGNLLGHITLGALLVQDACRAIPDFPDGVRTALLHLIVSHHGEKEFGSPVEPMTVEAFILSAIDDLDARVNQVRRAVAEDDGSGEFTAYHTRLGRVLWKGPGE